jgi:light-regulated signal transduction histidine kinase (bacteriophytochrome)
MTIHQIIERTIDEPARLATGAGSAARDPVFDHSSGRTLLDATQSALLNILEDFTEERQRFGDTQRAMLNILDDAAEEKGRLAETQRGMLNILDDFDIERQKSVQANVELRNEINERSRAEHALRLANASAQEANRELEAFCYSVAHDLRAPLRSIDGFSQALLEDCADKLDAAGTTYLGYVRESAQLMAQLIDALLSLSRLSRTELRPEPVDLAAVAQAILVQLRREQPNRSIELVAPAEIPVFGDARLLRIVLDNLLGNAWKYTRHCTHARIELGQTTQAEGPVYFVRDNGAGFNMAYADKLFAVFQRLHAVDEFEGTGIGLATVQRIVHRHHGSVWAEGEVGSGATFYFTLEEGK